MSRGVRVGVLIPQLNWGGAEKLVYDQLRNERGRDDVSFVVFVLRQGGTLSTAVQDLGWPVVVMAERNRFDLPIIGRLAAALRHQSIDLLHSHLPRAGIIGRMAARMAGIPSMYTEHNVGAGYPWLSRWLNRLTLPLEKHVVAVSEAVRREVLASNPGLSGRTSVVTNGVDVDALRSVAADRDNARSGFGLRSDDVLVLNVANMHRRKNQQHLIRAFCHVVRETGAMARLCIVGRDDGEGERLRGLVRVLGLEGSVSILGPRDDAAVWMAACDVFVLSSLVEGLPVSLLEACAMARPCVVTGVGGVPEVIADGVRGWLVEVGDAPALARSLAEAINDPATARRYGLAAQAWVAERFSISSMIKAYRALYHQLAAKKV